VTGASSTPTRCPVTHDATDPGEVIGVRAEADRAALAALPPAPYLVTDRHLRRAGRDCLISFEASLYSVPAHRIRPGQRVELRVDADTVAIHAPAGDPASSHPAGQLLATHPRSTQRGAWIVDRSHWDGLPDGHSRSTVVELPSPHRPGLPCDQDLADPADPTPLAALLPHRRGGDIPVARPLTDYAAAAGLEPTGAGVVTR
jgi:hypothetical protein